MKQKSDKISAVISSFDGFSDCWEPMIDSLLKFWPKNFFNIYLITNYLDSPNEQLIPSIKVGRDKGWASNLKYALERIDTKYVIYLQEDFWFTKKINLYKLLEIISFTTINKIDYFRLVPIPPSDQKSTEYGLTTKTSKYRCCLQASLWKKSFLEALLIDGENGWDFEVETSTRINQFFPNALTYSVNSNYLMRYCEGTAIRKNRWTNEAISIIKSNNYNINIKERGNESKIEIYLLKLSSRSLYLKIISFFLLRLILILKGKFNIKNLFKI
tara:strand:+ start:12924 stop:13739 length:816 start_codon:yes stop_codon:yes gene_type:complete